MRVSMIFKWYLCIVECVLYFIKVEFLLFLHETSAFCIKKMYFLSHKHISHKSTYVYITYNSFGLPNE